MANSVKSRARDLSVTFQQAVNRWSVLLEDLTPEQWALRGVNAPGITMGIDERRSVAVIAHHIAAGCAQHADMIHQLANSQPVWLQTLDLDALARLNAQHAANNPNPDKTATIQLLADNGADVAKLVRSLTDKQLDHIGDAYGFRITVEQFVTKIVIGHGDWHAASITATIES